MRWTNAAGLALAAALTAAAIFSGRNPDFEAACGADATLFCSGQIGGALVACLASHQGNLSSRCRDYGETLWACAEEARSQCPLSDIGDGSLKQCLMSRPQTLSNTCQETLKASRKAAESPR